MKEDEARPLSANIPYESSPRDRKCDLDEKDNVPRAEVSALETCLAAQIHPQTAEVIAARVIRNGCRPRVTVALSHTRRGVDLCVAQIHFRQHLRRFPRRRIIQIAPR